MTPPRRVTLQDIAQRLRLSKVSVSKALRDHSDISAQTRALVKKTAREMGYLPNLLARSLSSRRSRTIGVVVPKIAHNFFSRVIDGINDCASSTGYEIVLTVSHERADLEQRHLETLLSMRVDGLLVSVSADKPPIQTYERIRELGIPLVFFDRVIEGLGFSSVTVNDREGAYRLIEYAIGHGFRHIAHLAGHRHVTIGRERRAGYEHALRDHAIEPPSHWIVEGGFGEPDGYTGFRQLHAQGRLPDAIFCATFPLAIGVLDAMREIDGELLTRLQLLAFGTGSINRFLPRPCICADQSPREMGFRAMARLARELDDGDDAPVREVLPARIVAGTEANAVAASP